MRCLRSKFLTVLRFFVLCVFASTQIAHAQGLQCSDLILRQDENQPTKLQMAAFKWLTGAAALAPLLAKAGGFSGSGGGEGVISFPTPEMAKMAQSFIDKNQPIPEHIMKLATIKSLEAWESQKTALELFSVREDATWIEIYNQALNHIRVVSPIVASRLVQVSKWMEFSDWDGQSHIPNLGDANPISPLGQNEVRVQLAIRLSDGNNVKGQGPTTGALRLKVLFNRPLFDKLSAMDQAILVLHEQFYALGQAVGQQTSDHIRPLVRAFFTREAVDWENRSENGIRLLGITDFFKTKLMQAFGDYPMFFANVGELPRGEARSAARHLSVFGEVLRELREEMNKCLKGGLAGRACADQIQTSYLKKTNLTEEQAFVFLSYFYSERSLKALNAESIMNPESLRLDYEKAMGLACEIILQNANNFVDDLTGVPLAVKYCRSVR